MADNESAPLVRPPAPASPEWLPRWELIALASGDILAILLFVALGRDSHSIGDGGVLTLINSTMPFAIAWLALGAYLGAYQGTALYPLRRTILRTLVTGIFAVPLGVLLRAAVLDRPLILSFFIVATLACTAIILLWRIVWSHVRLLWWTELR